MKNKTNRIIAIAVIAVLVTNFITYMVMKSENVPTLSGDNADFAIVTSVNGEIVSDDLYEEMKDNSGLTTLLNLIDKQLLEAKYPSDQGEIKEDVDATVKDFTEYYESLGYDFDSVLEGQGFTMDSWKEEIALDKQKEALVYDYVLETTSDEYLQEVYDTISNTFQTKHILIKVDNTIPEVSDDQLALQYTEEILAELEATGDVEGNFSNFAEVYSTDSGTAALGGEFDFILGEAVTEYQDAVVNMNDGDVEIVKSVYGYHIIYKVGEIEKSSLEDSTEKIINDLIENYQTADTLYNDKVLVEFRKQSNVVILDDVLNAEYEEYVTELGPIE